VKEERLENSLSSFCWGYNTDMKITDLISRLQNFFARFQMWKAAVLLRSDYQNPSMHEFNALDAEDFMDS
jgi:hypothetical protein